MRLRQDGSELALVPHWGHAAGALVMLVLSGGIVALMVFAPQDPSKAYGPAYVLFSIQIAALLAWLTYPLWGGDRVSFARGVFRVLGRRGNRSTLELTVGELKSFEAESTDEGFTVVAVKTDGSRIPLTLEFGNPLYVHQKNSTARRQDYRQDAVEIARTLSEMLTEARRGYGTYR